MGYASVRWRSRTLRPPYFSFNSCSLVSAKYIPCGSLPLTILISTAFDPFFSFTGMLCLPGVAAKWSRFSKTFSPLTQILAPSSLPNRIAPS